MAFATVSSAAEAETLAAALLSRQRTRPHVVVSTPPGRSSSLIDVDGLAAGCGGLADVTVVVTGDATWRLADLMPERCAIWGGAGRVYPPGDDWVQDPLRSPLRFVYSPDEASVAGRRLLEDVLTMAAAAGLVGARPPDRGAARVRGAVEMVLAGGSRAFVRTTAGELVGMAADLAVPGIPLDWYAPVGTAVTGHLETASRLLRPVVERATAASVLRQFGPGGVTLGLVESSGRQEAELRLHPEVAVRVRRADVTSNPRDLVSQLLGAGEVVAVRVVRDPQGRLAPRLDDIEDDEPELPALPLIAGGPPWLQAGRDLVTSPEESGEESPLPGPPRSTAVAPELATAAASTGEDAPAALAPTAPASSEPSEPSEPPEPAPAPVPPSRPRPGPGPRRAVPPAAPAAASPAPTRPGGKALQEALQQLDLARAELRQLKAARTDERAAHAGESSLLLELGQERARVEGLKQQLRESQRAAADLRSRNRGSNAIKRSPLTSLDRFDVPEEWVRHEVRLAWIERFGPAERRTRAIDRGWHVGPDFATSLLALSDPQLRKTFRAMVDVIVGIDAALDGHEVPRLRTGPGGDDPYRVREQDGAAAWRIAIERKTASARRLHYWRTRSVVEFARVVLHDDFRM